jgi:hypothetical protein
MYPIDARNQLMITFITWAEDEGIVYAIDNQSFSNPEDTYIIFKVIFNGGSQVSLGNIGSRKYDTYGLIVAEVYTVQNTGTNTNDEICETVLELFDGQNINDIILTNGHISTGGNINGYYLQTVTCEFMFELTR